MSTSFLLANLYGFVRSRPEAWLGGLIINHGHYGIVVAALMFSKWQQSPIFHPETWWYLLGLSLALCLSAWAKVRLISGFHLYFHLKSVRKCPWCGREAEGYNPYKSKIDWLIIKRNIMFSILSVSILTTVWLPIIAHHMWVDTKFENAAFVISLIVAVAVSVLAAVAEIVFAYCTTIYKLDWTNAILVSINFLLLKLSFIIKLTVIGTFWFSIFGLGLVYLLSVLSLGVLLLPLLIVCAGIMQLVWLAHLDKYLLTLSDTQLLGKLKSLLRPTPSQ